MVFFNEIFCLKIMDKVFGTLCTKCKENKSFYADQLCNRCYREINK